MYKLYSIPVPNFKITKLSLNASVSRSPTLKTVLKTFRILILKVRSTDFAESKKRVLHVIFAIMFYHH